MNYQIMLRYQKRLISQMFCLVTLALLMVTATPAIADTHDTENHFIAPPTEKFEGLSYGGWAAEWWKWAY